MKTQEEIVIQAKAYAESIGNEDGTSAYDYVMGYNQCQEDMAYKKYTEEDIRSAIRNTITYLATLSKTGKFHSGNIIEEAIINSLNKQD